MAETIDEILNGSDEGTEQVVDQQADDVEEGQVDDQSTGEDDAQVAAENNDQADGSQTEVRAELKALSKERERIRQKEAALDAERAKLQEQQQSQQTAGTEGQSSQPADMKELRKQYREALSASLIDPSDEEAAKKVEALEDQLEDARINQVAQVQKSVTAQEKATTDFNEVFNDAHAKYPFLDPDHPQVSKELNEDINAFYEGLLRRGESKAAALRKAVDTFAPAQAKKLGLATTKPALPRQGAQAAASVAREKLKGGFSEVHGAGSSSRTGKPFTGPTSMDDILGRSST